MKNLKFLTLLLALTFFVTACSLNNNITQKQNKKNISQNKSIEENLEAQSNIKKFNNLKEFSDFLKNNEPDQENFAYNKPMMRGLSGGDLAFSAIESEAVMASPKSIGAENANQTLTSDDFSKTNIQVEGVDEADIIKNDGKYIYALVKNELYIINAYPAEKAEVLSKIKFKDRPQNLYINDDRLIVYGQDYSFRNNGLYKNFIRQDSFTFLKIFDLVDRKNPKQLKDLNFEGDYSNSRMIGDYIYLITNNYNYRYIADEPVLPRIIDGSTVLKNNCESNKCFSPDIYYFNIPYHSYNMTSVSAINIKNLNQPIKGDVYLLDPGQNMYVSPHNIFLTYTKYISEYEITMKITRDLIYPRLNAEDQEKIEKIEKVENFILSKDEKQNKVNQILEAFIFNKNRQEQKKIEKEIEEAVKQKYQDISKELEKTIIHKIAINKGDLDYQGNGEVTGHVLNQFSMNESTDGYFRIATTKNRTWSRFLDDEEKKSYNNLYILDKNLKVVGKVEDLAKGEQIKSVRFMQNKAFLVTFKQIDPLFVIDLKNPTNPKILGELKIPGYSDYLHPYDDHTLIGLGKDAFDNDNNRTVTGGIKLSLFDISDFNNPKEIDHYIMGDSGSDSIALRDHKALYFEHDKNLLSIPVTLREKNGDKYYNTRLSFNGAMVFHIDKHGFELKGKIDHLNGEQISNRNYWGGYSYDDNNVQRILRIDNTLYTFSNKELKMNKISNLENINDIKFIPDDIEIINKIDDGYRPPTEVMPLKAMPTMPSDKIQASDTNNDNTLN